jgi:hypothetical protein
MLATSALNSSPVMTTRYRQRQVFPERVFASPQPHGLALPLAGPHTRRHQPDPIAFPSRIRYRPKRSHCQYPRYLVLYSTIERKDTSGQLLQSRG